MTERLIWVSAWLRYCEILLGTDGEKTLTNSLDSNFPSAKRKLCTKHIKDNLKHHLTDTCPTDPKSRQQIINKIFGPAGVASTETTFEFDESFIIELKENEHIDFANYYATHVKHKLHDHVINHSTSDFWTNNNAESMNNRMKQAIDWKPMKADELIEKMYGIVKVQFVDMRQAMYESGNFSVNCKY